MSWNKKNIGSSVPDPNSHTHTNKTFLDKFGESSGSPTYNGLPIVGESSVTDSSGLFYSYQNLWVNPVARAIGFTPVEPSTTYVSNCLKSISCYDINQQLISTISPTINNDSNNFAPRPFVTPVGTKYIKATMPGIFNDSWVDRIILIKGGAEALPIQFQYIGVNPPDAMYIPKEVKFYLNNNAYAKSLGVQTSPLYGMKINFIGDSITNGNWADPDTGTVITYHQLIARKFNVLARNYGYAGSGFVNMYDTNNAYFKRVEAMDADADMITVWGGFNDRQQPLGTFGDTWNESSPTVFGGIDQLIKNLRVKYPNKPIVFFIHFANDELTTPINNAVKTMCNFYKIPFVDLSPTILSDNYNTIILQNYFRQSDWSPTGNQGIHPNSAGQKIVARKITSGLEEILAYL